MLEEKKARVFETVEDGKVTALTVEFVVPLKYRPDERHLSVQFRLYDVRLRGFCEKLAELWESM